MICLPVNLPSCKERDEIVEVPEYIKFYVNPTKRAVAIQTCGIDDDGAKRVPYGQIKEGASIKIMYLTKMVYEICNWDKKKTYRVSFSRMYP